MCYQRLGRVSEASAKLLPLYLYLCVCVFVYMCTHAHKMAFRLLSILLNETNTLLGGCSSSSMV